MVPDRATPVIPLVTELPIFTTHFPPAGNIVNSEQKSVIYSQAITDRVATESPTAAGSPINSWDADDYLPSGSGPLGKPDISEIKEEGLQSTTVTSQHATASHHGITEDTQTHESVTQIEQIEVGPLVTSMEITNHISFKEFLETKTPLESTEVTLEQHQTDMPTVITSPELATTSHYGVTLREDDREDIALTVRSGQSTRVFSQIPEVITVSKTSEDTTYSQLGDLEFVSTATITMLGTDGSLTDEGKEPQTDDKTAEDEFGQSQPTIPFPSQHLTEVESLPYSGDTISVERISTVSYPSLQTDVTQGRERTEVPRPGLKKDPYAVDEIQEKITKDPFIGTTEEGFSGMSLSTSSSETSAERTESVSPALTIEKLTVKPAVASDVDEMTILTRLETDVTTSDEDVTSAHLTHSTLNVEVVTVLKWPGNEDNSTSKPLPPTERAGFTKSPPVSLSTVGIVGKDKETPSFTDGGDEYTLSLDGTPKPLEKFSEEDLTSGEFAVTIPTSISIGSAEKSTLGEPTTGDRVLSTTSTKDLVINATVEGSALDEDMDASKPLFTATPFVHTSDVEESAFVNYSSTQQPTTYVDISHTSPLSIIPKTEWSVSETSVPLEDEVLGKSDQDTLEQTHLEATMSPEALSTIEVTQGETQEEPQTPGIPFPALSSTAVMTKETTAFEEEGEGSTYTLSEDRLMTDSEIVPSLETTPVGTSYPGGAMTQQEVEMDTMVTQMSSIRPTVVLSTEPEVSYEAEGSSPMEFASTLKPFGTQVTQLVEETTEEGKKTPLDYTDLGSGLFEQPRVTELPDFSMTPSDISVFTAIDSLHRTTPLRPPSPFTEEPHIFEKEPSEKTTGDIILPRESVTQHPLTTLMDIIAKKTESDIDHEYHMTSKPPVMQPTRPSVVERKTTSKPQELSTSSPPAGTKFHPDINVYIIEVRENKTGKSLLSRQSAFSLAS